MLFLLMEERAVRAGPWGPSLEFRGGGERDGKAVSVESAARVHRRHEAGAAAHYKMLVAQAKQPLLHHKPILKPLMMLLSACSSSSTMGHSSSCTVGPKTCSSVAGLTCTMGPSSSCTVGAKSSSSGRAHLCGGAQQFLRWRWSWCPCCINCAVCW